MSCPICKSKNSSISSHPTRDAFIVDCPQCGKYVLSRSVQVNLASEPAENRWRISAWLSQHKPDVLTSSDVDAALNAVMPTLTTRADRMLRWIRANFPPGKSFSVNELGNWEPYRNTPGSGVAILGGSLLSSRLVPIGWNRDIDEMAFMVTEVLCNELGLLGSQNNTEYQVSPKGLLYLGGGR